MTARIKLDTGWWLWNRYGKYEPNLTFLLPPDYLEDKDLPWEKTDPRTFNLEAGSLSAIRGKYFKSKKDTDVFKVLSDGPHILIRDSWGGAFNTYYGREIFKLPNILYKRRAASNGGGLGEDYVIVPVGTTYILSEEDI